MPKMLTADKAIDVLEAVAAAPDGMGTRELARVLDMGVATAHNLARTLEARGYLRQSPDTRRFHLGLRIMMLARQDRHLQSLSSLARPHVEALARTLDESIMLGILDRGQVLNLHYIPSRQALRVHESEDLRPIAYCTAIGKLMLAQLSSSELDAYLLATPLKPFTPHTIVDRSRLEGELARARQHGLGVSVDELCEGVSAVAVAVRDTSRQVIAAIGASGPTVRMQHDRLERIRRELQKTAACLEKTWAAGWKGEQTCVE